MSSGDFQLERNADGSRLLENAALWKLGAEVDQKRLDKASLAVSRSLIAERLG